jgi:glycosyltransferase involved in cell wall biosynthesis
MFWEDKDKSVVAVIFSKDRAMQLDACLRSFALHCKDIDQCHVCVIYTTSHERFERQYETLRSSYLKVEFIRQTCFHSDLVRTIKEVSHVMFLVDDNLFTGEWSLTEVLDALKHNGQTLGFSLRLGINTIGSYSLNKAQNPPEFREVAPNILKFSWTTALHDFGYPLEVSSSVYKVEHVLPLIKSSSAVTNPNSLEAFLDSSKDRFRTTQQELLCFARSVAFCNPVNIVQNDWINRSGDSYEHSVFGLMRRFDLGYRIDLRPFENFVSNACHQEVDLSFLTPEAECGKLKATIEFQSLGNKAQDHQGSQKDISASSFLNLSDLNKRDKDRIGELLYSLRAQVDSQDWLLELLKRNEELTRHELTHLQSKVVVLNKKLAEINRLKEEWYEPELSRFESLIRTWYEPELVRLKQQELLVKQYEPELAHLRSELGRAEHRLVRKLRLVLKSRAPFIFYLTRYLLPRLVVRCSKFAGVLGKIEAIINTHVVSQLAWPTEQPLISVVIPNFNYGKYLHKAIDSVLDQTFQDLEIIVVDDASTDPYTREILAAMDRPKTKVIFQQNNQGLPKTRNKGIEMARGKYICCLDPDDYLDPTYLEKCVYHLETRNLDVCCSWVQVFGDSRDVWETGPFLIDVLMKGNCVSVSAVFKKASWEKAGGYKEAMTHHICDDWEFWLTLSEQGAIGFSIPEPLMFYRKHTTSMSANLKDRYEEIVDRIKSLHSNLYNDPFKVRKIRKLQQRRFTVTNPFCNLVRKRTVTAEALKHQIRVLLVTPWFQLGGASVVKRDVFTHLAKDGVRVTAIAATASAGAYTEDGLQFYKAITDECFNLPRFLEGQKSIDFVKYLIESREIQLLYLTGSQEGYEMLPELKKSFPELMVMDEQYNLVGHLERNREFRKFIDLNIVVNDEIRECLISLGETEDRIVVITPGVDAERFSRHNPIYTEAVVRRPYKEFTFGFLGRLSPEKRPQDFVQLAMQMPSCQFRIAGDGPLTSHIAEEIATQRILNRCHLEGSTDNPLAFLAGIDALVITSEVEGLPIALLEAMALELPVIATAIGGIPRVLVHRENGFLYNPCQIDELVSISTMLSQMTLSARQAIGRNARETVLKGHTISTCATKYLTVFKQLVTGEKSLPAEMNLVRTHTH